MFTIFYVEHLACQMTPESWVKRSRPVTTLEKDTASTTAEPLRRWLQVHTLEGRIVLIGSEGDDMTYVDPRRSSRSKTAMDSIWPGSAEILYEWEYELPRGWEQHHDEESKIYSTKV